MTNTLYSYFERGKLGVVHDGFGEARCDPEYFMEKSMKYTHDSTMHMQLTRYFFLQLTL